MSFPWVFHENFEAGTKGDFNSETDTDSKLDIAHYSEIARFAGIPAPFRGAYAVKIDLSLGTNDAYLQEDAGFDIALDATLYMRFMLWVDPNLVMATTDEFILLALQSSGPVDEAVIVLNYTTANGLRIGMGETSGSQFLPCPQGKWLAVELYVNLDAGGGNDGTLDMWLDGASATQITGLDQAAIVQARIGAIGIDAGTTSGYLMIDDVITDDTQVYYPKERFSSEITLTKSGHAFIGSGKVDNVTLLSGAATDNVLKLFDTDTADVNAAEENILELKNTANNETVDPAGVPVHVTNGCYVELTGTNPRAKLNICYAGAYGSDGAVRGYGLRRTG